MTEGPWKLPSGWRWVGLGGAAQPNMNAQILSSLKVPVPRDKRIQQRIVSYLDRVAEKVRQLKRAQEETDGELARLEGAILERAFRGEL